MTPNYRAGDPATSQMAGDHIERCGSAHDQRTRCFDAVMRQPGLTAREIERQLGLKAHKRLPELRHANLVRNGSPRTCAVSGRQALTWLPL